MSTQTMIAGAKKSLTDHAKQDSKIIWTIILLIGVLSGNVGKLIDYVTPAFDSRYVTKTEFEEFKQQLGLVETSTPKNNTNLSVE